MKNELLEECEDPIVEAKCESCKISFVEHLGLEGTCAELKSREMQIKELYSRLTRAEAIADQRIAIRRELEEAIGFKDGETYNEKKFKEAVKIIKKCMKERVT